MAIQLRQIIYKSIYDTAFNLLSIDTLNNYTFQSNAI